MPHNFRALHFRLKPGVTKSEFMTVHKIYHRHFIAMQRGFLWQTISIDEGIWQNEPDKWEDFVVWESKEHIIDILDGTHTDPAVTDFLSLIELLGPDEKVNLRPELVRKYP